MNRVLFLLVVLGVFLGATETDSDQSSSEDFLNKFQTEATLPFPAILEKSATRPSLNVLAWNVGQTRQTPSLRADFEANIKGLIGSEQAPDLFLFIEANDSTFKSLDKIPFETYGYNEISIVPYSVKNLWAYFVLVWKSPALELTQHSVKPLSFDIRSPLATEVKKYEAMRKYIGSKLSNLEDVSLHKFDFEFYGKNFSLYPVHLSNVWPFIESYVYPHALEGSKSWALPEWIEKKNAELAAKVLVLKTLVTQNANPHSVLLKDMLNSINLEHPLTNTAQEDSVLVMGDFNAFPRINTYHGTAAFTVFGTHKSHACAEMEKHFTPIYVPEPHYSFPSESYKAAVPDSNFKLLIDLAYMRGPLFGSTQAVVLPLAGSDHYPVYYTILLKP